MLNLFTKHKDIFSEKLGKIPKLPVETKLREKVKPFQSPAHIIPHVFMQFFENDKFNLVFNEVIVQGIELSWK